jgi:hypothetical protein
VPLRRIGERLRPDLSAGGIAQPSAMQFLLADVDPDDLHPTSFAVAKDLPTD